MKIRIPGSISCNSALINLKRPCDSGSLRNVCISGCIATLIACIVEELKDRSHTQRSEVTCLRIEQI